MLNIAVLGKNIKKYRIEKQMTQEQLAEQLLVSYQAISNWERGITPPNIENLCDLASLFHVSTDKLIGRENFKNDGLMIGIDGGGTKTELVLFSKHGEVLNKVRCAQTNPIDIGMERCCQILDEGIQRLLCDTVNVQGIFAGIAGTSVDDNAKRIADHLKKKFNISRVWVDSDAVNVIASRISGTDGMALICGTGSVLFARENGQVHRVGGWGYLFDESGSAYDIGKDAIRAALAQLDGMGERTMLVDMLRTELQSELWDSLNKLYSKGKLYIASLAPLVFEAAVQGDQVASEIIQKNVSHLALLINTAQKLYQCGNEIVACGGIFDHRRDVLIPMLEQLVSADIKFIIPELPPVYGACVECCRMMDIIPNQEFYDTFYNTYMN